MFGGGLFVSLPWRGVGCSAMYGRMIRSVFLLWSYLWVFAFSVYSRDRIGETLSGPDSHDTGQGPHGHLFGDWGGERSHLLQRGVRFDFQYITDSLWNIKSEQKTQLFS
jgi:hypothetical protein